MESTQGPPPEPEVEVTEEAEQEEGEKYEGGPIPQEGSPPAPEQGES